MSDVKGSLLMEKLLEMRTCAIAPATEKAAFGAEFVKDDPAQAASDAGR